MSQQLSTNTFTVAKWVVSPDATQGTHTTIQAAINAASSGDNVFVRPGTYTEDLTLKAGVNLTGLRGDGKTPTVTIIGNCTHNTAGTVSIADFRLQTNGSFCISNTGTLVSIMNIISCVINATNNTAISFTNSNAAAQINIVTSALDIGTTGIALYSMSSAGTLNFRYCNTTNGGGTSTASASSAGTVNCLYTNLLSPVSTSGTAVFNNTYSSIDTSAQNATCQTSTGNGTHTANYSSYSSGTASALSIGGTSTQTLSNATVTSSNVNAITGAGSGVLRYSLLRFSGTSAGINVPTTTPFVAANLIGTTINVSTDANASTINLGTGAAVKSVSLGSTTTTSVTSVFSGSGGLNIDSSAGNGALTIKSGTGTIAISGDNTAATVGVGNGAGVKACTFGSTNSTSSTILQSGSGALNVTATNGALTIKSGTGTLAIGNDATAQTITFATGAGVKAVQLGSSNTTSSMSIFSGSGAFNITATNGALTIKSGTGTLAIANDATAQTVNIATGAGVKATTLGSNNSTSSVTIVGGTNGVTIANNAIAMPITIGNGTGATNIDILTGTGAANFATNNTDHITNLGGFNGSSGTFITSGTAGVQLNSGLLVDNLGRMTNTQQPCFFAYKSSNTANVTGDATQYQIIFDTSLFDNGSHYNTGTGVFTAPVTGRYMFIFSASPYNLGAAHTTMNMYIVTTARTYFPVYINPFAMAGSGNQIAFSASCIATMTAGETANCQFTVSLSTKTVGISGSATSNATYFTGYLIC